MIKKIELRNFKNLDKLVVITELSDLNLAIKNTKQDEMVIKSILKKAMGLENFISSDLLDGESEAYVLINFDKFTFNNIEYNDYELIIKINIDSPFFPKYSNNSEELHTYINETQEEYLQAMQEILECNKNFNTKETFEKYFLIENEAYPKFKRDFIMEYLGKNLDISFSDLFEKLYKSNITGFSQIILGLLNSIKINNDGKFDEINYFILNKKFSDKTNKNEEKFISLVSNLLVKFQIFMQIEIIKDIRLSAIGIARNQINL